MKVLKYPNEILKKKAEPVEKIDDEIKSIASEMATTMYQSHGVGLAAPQVGISKQIIVVNPTAESGKETVYINPKILKRKGREEGEEGCLSFPGLYGNVMRAKWVRVSAMLLSGDQVVFDAEDFTARVLQHEIDHLNGILFVEKLAAADKVLMKRQIEQIETVPAKA